MSKPLKLSRAIGVNILAVIIASSVILSGTAYYYGWYAPQQQQQQQNLLTLFGLPIGGSVNILTAGSLQGVLTTAAQEFEALHPGVNIYITSAGSIDCANRIKQGQPCDLFFSADFYVIKNMLYQTPIPSFPVVNYTDWWVDFATNTLCIAYSPTAIPLTNTTWYTALSTGYDNGQKVTWARANPDQDPCGYRTLIMLNISDTYYPDHSSEYPGYPVNPSNSSQGILLSEVESKPSPSWITVAAKSANIIALLQANELDYGIVYESNANQSGLNYVALPDNVSLGYQPYNAWYSQFSVTPTTTTYQGSWIQYRATIPNTAQNRYWAIEFLKFVLSPLNGQAILKAGSQPTINPPIADGVWGNVPPEIQNVSVEA